MIEYGRLDKVRSNFGRKILKTVRKGQAEDGVSQWNGDDDVGKAIVVERWFGVVRCGISCAVCANNPKISKSVS
jgi:hypothetical protein